MLRLLTSGVARLSVQATGGAAAAVPARLPAGLPHLLFAIARHGTNAGIPSSGLHTSAVVSEKDSESSPRKRGRPRKTLSDDAALTETKKKVTKRTTKKADSTTAKAAPAKKKAPKRVLNPPKPIRSAYLLFYLEKIADLPKEEKKNVTQLSPKIVEEFRALSASDRAALDERLAERKKQYDEDLEEFRKSLTPELIAAENEYRRAYRAKSSTKTKKPRLLRDPSKPSVPLNGYMRFCNVIRQDPSRIREVFGADSLSEVSVIEQGKALAEAWRAASDSEKVKYNDEYKKEKEVYEAELADWKAKNNLA